MPLRGALFRKLKKFKKEREKHESIKFKKESIKESKLLKKLRTQRIKQEGRAILKKQIASEKARIKAAKGPSKISAIERFFAKKTAKAAKIGIKQARKRVKIEFNTGGSSKRKRRKKRKTKRRKR